MDTQADRLRRARLARGFTTASDAAKAFGWNVNTYSSNENGNATFSFKKAGRYAAAFGVRAEWLYEGTGPMKASAETGSVALIGKVGANPEGNVLFATGDRPNVFVPHPGIGSDRVVALEVAGHSMRGLADDGALIYFDDQRTPPTPDMLGHVVVVETEGDEVLVKRLLRGGKRGRFDLESLAGPTLRDARLRWAAHIISIVPPFMARRLLRTGEAA